MKVFVRDRKVYIDKYHLQLPMLAMEWIARFDVTVNITEYDDGETYYFVLELSKRFMRSEALAYSIAADLEKQI